MILRQANRLVRGMHLNHRGRKWTIDILKEEGKFILLTSQVLNTRKVQNLALFPEDYVSLWDEEENDA